MLYQPQITPIQSSKLLPAANTGASNGSKKSTSLPSFNELLTSIPLPTDFKSSANTTPKSTNLPSPSYSYYSSSSSTVPSSIPTIGSTIASAAVTSATGSAPMQQHRLPTPPLYSTSQQVSPNLQHSQPSYQYYNYQPQQQVVMVGSTAGHVLPPPPPQQYQSQPIVRPSPIPITPTTTSFDINPKIRSSSTGDLSSHPNHSRASMLPSFTPVTTASINTSPISTTNTNTTTTTTTSPKDPRRKHVCKVCSRSFTTSGHLARHNRIHTGERKHECPWPTCDARFARQDNCNQHYKTHTNGKNKRNRNHNNTNATTATVAGVQGNIPVISNHHLSHHHQHKYNGKSLV